MTTFNQTPDDEHFDRLTAMYEKAGASPTLADRLALTRMYGVRFDPPAPPVRVAVQPGADAPPDWTRETASSTTAALKVLKAIKDAPIVSEHQPARPRSMADRLLDVLPVQNRNQGRTRSPE